MASIKQFFNSKHLLGAVSQIGSLTAISRVLGFLRDILIAIFIGAGPLADAFFVAFKVPNMFRRMTAEGAMTNAFMPAYMGALKKSDKTASSLLSEVQITLLWGLVILVGVMELFMPVLITLIAPGFERGGTRYHDAITFTRITLPFLPMISLVALWAAVSNAHDRFLGGAMAPIILNLFLIGGALICGLAAGLKALPLAVAVPLSGIFQLLFLLRELNRIGRLPQWRILPRITAASHKMWKSFFVAILGAGGMQINLLVDTILASLLPVGSIAALYYADRIAQLPLGVIGIALGTALLPRLARFEVEGERIKVIETLAKGCQLGMFFAIPSMVAVLLIAEHIIGGLFAYGAFDKEQIAPVSMVLMAYGVGIPAFILVKILQSAFFAADDPKTPMLITLVAIVINVVLSIMLMRLIGVVGIALATSIASWTTATLMLIVLGKRKRINLTMLSGFVKILLAIAVMAVLLQIGKIVFISLPLPIRAIELLLLVVLGMIGYFGSIHLLKAWPSMRT